MAPSEYIDAQLNGDKDNEFYRVIVDECPYYPFLTVDPNNPDSIHLAASLIVNNDDDNSNMTRNASIAIPENDCRNREIFKVSGGITNQLYRVSVPGIQTTETNGNSNDDDDDVRFVLVRLFGAEGMIDRNVENATFAALARQGLAPRYFGRFQNGRIEQWLEAKPLSVQDMANEQRAIATQLGHLHAHFHVPSHLIEYHNPNKPALWVDLHSWMNQALSADFQTDHDKERAGALQLPAIAKELEWLEQDVVPSNAQVAFCHNDVLAANILKLNNDGHDDPGNDNSSDNSIQLIDFEYGGINYKAFDIANHFNEYAGGTDNAIPNYDWAPTRSQQADFVKAYLQASSSSSSCSNGDTSVESMLEEVQAFIMVNHLYWGLWAVNQASTEGCNGFDYLLYAKNRIQQYYKCKQEHLLQQ